MTAIFDIAESFENFPTKKGVRGKKVSSSKTAKELKKRHYQSKKARISNIKKRRSELSKIFVNQVIIEGDDTCDHCGEFLFITEEGCKRCVELNKVMIRLNPDRCDDCGLIITNHNGYCSHCEMTLEERKKDAIIRMIENDRYDYY